MLWKCSYSERSHHRLRAAIPALRTFNDQRIDQVHRGRTVQCGTIWEMSDKLAEQLTQDAPAIREVELFGFDVLSDTSNEKNMVLLHLPDGVLECMYARETRSGVDSYAAALPEAFGNKASSLAWRLLHSKHAR